MVKLPYLNLWTEKICDGHCGSGLSVRVLCRKKLQVNSASLFRTSLLIFTLLVKSWLTNCRIRDMWSLNLSSVFLSSVFPLYLLSVISHKMCKWSALHNFGRAFLCSWKVERMISKNYEWGHIDLSILSRMHTPLSGDLFIGKYPLSQKLKNEMFQFHIWLCICMFNQGVLASLWEGGQWPLEFCL